MIHQWLEVFGPIKGDIECISLVFHIANRLRLTNNCIVSHISEPRSMMDLDFFRQAQILKKTNNIIFMRYHGMITEIPLPNTGLGIYAVRDYLVGLQPLPLNRSTFARLANAPPMHYYGQIQHQKDQDTLHTLINRAHQDNIIHGHPHHHITH
jgi:hypothetical protein